MKTTVETLGSFLAVATLVGGCGNEDAAGSAQPAAPIWSVTVWGDLYEVFPEVGALTVGQTSQAHIHVTDLADFSAPTEAEVEILLTAGDRTRSFSSDEADRADQADRAGIFIVDVQPDSAGEYDLTFRVTSAAGSEEIRGGRVRVGEDGTPGFPTRLPAPKGGSAGGEPLPFLKEEQWRVNFGTSWVREGEFADSVDGVARVRPPAGGAVTITAPVDAVLLPEPWPFPGRSLDRGDTVLGLVPRIATDRSLAALDAARRALATELEAARSRLGRLEELYELDATSRRELDEARALVKRLEAEQSAAARDYESARSSREGGTEGAMSVAAPFSGEIAAVLVSPGEVVSAGAPLVRLVDTRSVWLEIQVTPEAARRLDAGIAGVVVRFAEGSSLRIADGSRIADVVHLVSIAPEIDSRTGTVAVLLEVPPSSDLLLGTRASVQVLLDRKSRGIVVPTTALVDDGGTTIVYLQLSGESFARQPVRVIARQGDDALVDGLLAGQRLVTRGGEDIRRSSLMASGEAHGHVH